MSPRCQRLRRGERFFAPTLDHGCDLVLRLREAIVGARCPPEVDAPTRNDGHVVCLIGRGSQGRPIRRGNRIAPRLLRHEIRVVLVVVPLGGIGLDAFADRGQFCVIANDVFVIPTLPDGRARGMACYIDVSRDGRFV